MEVKNPRDQQKEPIKPIQSVLPPKEFGNLAKNATFAGPPRFATPVAPKISISSELKGRTVYYDFLGVPAEGVILDYFFSDKLNDVLLLTDVGNSLELVSYSRIKFRKPEV